MPIYVFIRDEMFYPVEEESDEKILASIPLNPGTRRVEEMPSGRVVWQETKQ